jgi:hypothetical protein
MGVSYTETEDCMKLHLVRNEMLLNKWTSQIYKLVKISDINYIYINNLLLHWL